MKIKETKISEAQMDEVYERVKSDKEYINIDATDVRSVIAGREGVMYEASQEDTDRSEFMKAFFEELASKQQVQGCSRMFISIGMDDNDPLSMSDLNYVNDFMSLFIDDVDVIWGVKSNKPGTGLSLLAVCMN